MTRTKKLASLGALAITMAVIPTSIAASCSTEGESYVDIGPFGITNKFNAAVSTPVAPETQTLNWKQASDDEGEYVRNMLELWFHEGIARNILGSTKILRTAFADGTDYAIVPVYKVSGGTSSNGFQPGGTQGELIKKYDRVGTGGTSLSDFTKEMFQFAIDELWNSISALPASEDKAAIKTWFKSEMTRYKTGLIEYENNFPAPTGFESVNAGAVTDALNYAIAKS